MNTRENTYVSAGKELMALVDANSFWKAGYFKETRTVAAAAKKKIAEPVLFFFSGAADLRCEGAAALTVV
jgi:hypothetical protein